MKRKRSYLQILPAFAMVVLILDTKTALKGASEGLSLCIQTLLPSLMPFIFLSIILSSTLLGRTNPISSRLAEICHMERGTESLLLVGLLGGYPVGAQTVGAVFTARQIGKAQAERMLAFCNNAGPAFIFGVIGHAFSSSIYSWLLWVIHIASALFVGIIYPQAEHESVSLTSKSIPCTTAMQLTIKALSNVCGWVILFRTILCIMERWLLWALPVTAQVITTGLLELANGCIQLTRIESEATRFITASVLLSLGGMCVTMQTLSSVGGLSCKHYFTGKALQTVFSILLSQITCKVLIKQSSNRIPVYADLALLLGFISLATVIFQKKNRSRNPAHFGV